MMSEATVTEKTNPHRWIEDTTWSGEEGEYQIQQALKLLSTSAAQRLDLAEIARNCRPVCISSNYRFILGVSKQVGLFSQGCSAIEQEPISDTFYAPLEASSGIVFLSPRRDHRPFTATSPSEVFDATARFSITAGIVPVQAADALSIGRQLEGLKKLKDGWADGIQPVAQWGEGYGKAPDPAALDWLAGRLAAYYAVDAPKPHIYPTPEGGVSLEWSIGPHRASLEIDFDTCQAEWHSLDLSTDVSYEQDLQLGIPQSWEWLESEVRRLGNHAA